MGFIKWNFRQIDGFFVEVSPSRGATAKDPVTFVNPVAFPHDNQSSELSAVLNALPASQ
jgi:hypothetical protein